MSDDLKRYAVKLCSKAGPYAQYGPGEVKVWAEDEESAVDKAFRELKRGAFPDRSREMWRVLDVRRVWSTP